MIDDDDDAEPTEEELREAEALARALDRGTAPLGVPEDALATAAMLRFAKDEGALGKERSEAILADVLARARPPAPRRALGWRTGLFGLLGLAAAGAASLVLVARAPSPEVAAALPAPPRALLEAQLAAAGARTASLEAMTAEAAGYRAAVYATLKERYRK